MTFQPWLLVFAASFAAIAPPSTKSPVFNPEQQRSPGSSRSSQDAYVKLRTLIAEGKLRPAQQSDIDHLLDIWRKLRSQPRSEPIDWQRSLDRTYVILKPLRIPGQMYGGNSAAFLLAPGVASPSDQGSHNIYISLETGSCSKAAGRSCGMDFPWLIKTPLGVTISNCQEGAGGSRYDNPIPAGPLRLVEISCLNTSAESYVAVSPDGGMVAGISTRTPRNVIIYDKSTGTLKMVETLGAAREFVGQGRQSPSFAWSAKSDSFWSWTQPRTMSGGWIAGGGVTLRVSKTGVITSLPPLISTAGPLDGLHWIGMAGKALAFFGTRGNSYRPAHADPAPELAIVAAGSGAILDRLPFSKLPSLTPRAPGTADLVVRGVTMAILPDGRVKTVVRAGALIIWTERHPPVVLADPYPQEQDNLIRLLPDGKALLITRTLQPLGIRCSECGPQPPPQPSEGPLLEMHDLATGKVRWTLRARTASFWSAPVLSVSNNGRYALVSYPPEQGWPRIALILLKDGSVLQKIPVGSPGSYDPEAGFINDDRKVWMRVGGGFETFRFSPP